MAVWGDHSVVEVEPVVKRDELEEREARIPAARRGADVAAADVAGERGPRRVCVCARVPEPREALGIHLGEEVAADDREDVQNKHQEKHDRPHGRDRS